MTFIQMTTLNSIESLLLLMLVVFFLILLVFIVKVINDYYYSKKSSDLIKKLTDQIDDQINNTYIKED